MALIPFTFQDIKFNSAAMDPKYKLKAHILIYILQIVDKPCTFVTSPVFKYT